jgi:hypothetical protein
VQWKEQGGSVKRHIEKPDFFYIHYRPALLPGLFQHG